MSFDFSILNPLGFLGYTVYSLLLAYHPIIREQYASRHSRLSPHSQPSSHGSLSLRKDSETLHYPQVSPSDIAFAIHAFVLSTIGLVQVLYYGLLPRWNEWRASRGIKGRGRFPSYCSLKSLLLPGKLRNALVDGATEPTTPLLNEQDTVPDQGALGSGYNALARSDPDDQEVDYHPDTSEAVTPSPVTTVDTRVVGDNVKPVGGRERLTWFGKYSLIGILVVLGVELGLVWIGMQEWLDFVYVIGAVKLYIR